MDTVSDGPEYLTAAEAAAIIRAKPWAITERCRSGEIPAIKPAKAWLIRPDDFAAYLERHSNTPAGDAA